MGCAFGWLEARLSLQSLLKEIDGSTGRIAELVKAVKAYSYMDRSPMQEVDIHEGIENTLTMLGHKLKNVTVTNPVENCEPAKSVSTASFCVQGTIAYTPAVAGSAFPRLKPGRLIASVGSAPLPAATSRVNPP